MKYLIDGEVYDSAAEAAEYIAEQIDEDEYDEMLDECYEDISMGYLSWSMSTVLYKCDEVAYDMGFDEYKGACQCDIESDIDDMDYGDEESFHNCNVEVMDEVLEDD